MKPALDTNHSANNSMNGSAKRSLNTSGFRMKRLNGSTFDMDERRLLTEREIKDSLKKLKGWKLQRGKLHREYKFDSFVEAFGFMTSVAITAESMNHHP